MGGLLAGATGAYLDIFFAHELKRFFSRTKLVTVISLACVAFMLHIAYTAPTSKFFDRIPYLAREIWWALHRDIFSLATIFLILGAIHTPNLFGGWLRGFLSWKGFYPIAQLSYSVYMVHEMIFWWLFPRLAPHFARRLGAYGTMAVDSLIGGVVVFALAVTLYVLIERPCMRMRSHPAIVRFIDFLGKDTPKASTNAA